MITQGKVIQINIIQGKITLGRVTWGKLIITQGKDKVTQDKLTWVDMNTQDNFTFCRSTQDKSNDGTITQGKVTQSIFNLGRYRYPHKVTQGIITEGKLMVSLNKFNLGRYIYFLNCRNLACAEDHVFRVKFCLYKFCLCKHSTS